ncbi:adenylate kinase [Candidatus Falkowbacteria bacterium RIFCSPLOWO2_12_FULL_45_10]|uniref:Adenylate kinase n=1 Tax=Candidatus Falkowbacteria bacterium RIFCSPLOWO2_12_FULL_45_10 TaxID=1797990 RepID=A0A1F5RZS8_9BACT|nr:MAG: adenylate kinase [Candidatus Falkowbacteria bacterium RIFCSPLOWO2_12_FULL_45_10]
MSKLIICLLGPQGSGKGTQAKILSQKLNLPHISVGDLFRLAIESNTELGRQVGPIINSGKLVPDEIAFNLLKERIANLDCSGGFILDGYPRTIKQAELLDQSVKLDKVVVIEISDAEAVKRLTSRRHCPRCGAIYNLYTLPKPHEDELCDKCKVKLVQRVDDTETAVRERLQQYHAITEPLIKHYQDQAVKINGEQTIEQVAADIAKSVGRLQLNQMLDN